MALQPDFVERTNKDLDVTPKIYHRADWIQNVYGYPPMSQVISGTYKIQLIRGALVCSDDKVLFVIFDKQLGKYVSLWELSYDEITDVTIAKQRDWRRLVIKEKKNFYSLDIVSGTSIDIEKTTSFYNYILGKLKR